LADHAERLGRLGPPYAGVHPRDHAGPDLAGAAVTDRPEFNQVTMISGVDYDEASAGASDVQVGGVHFRVPSRATLIANKRASGRPKDIEDADRLEALATGGE
jgi:hypothetical protein